MAKAHRPEPTELGRRILEDCLDGSRWMLTREVAARSRLGVRSTAAILQRLYLDGHVDKRVSDAHGALEWADVRDDTALDASPSGGRTLEEVPYLSIHDANDRGR